jgi:transcriptional regulator with XRE-family HTH domain
VDTQAVARNRALQSEWYGEPLGDRIRKVLERLDLTQAGLAGVLGISAPMLSQLMSGQRAKISNPAVLGRLVEAERLAFDDAFARLSPEQRRHRLDEIKAAAPTTSLTTLRTQEGAVDQAIQDPVTAIQALLRALASAGEIESAAILLDRSHPELAALLRVYGNGRTGEAREHYARTLGRS